MFPPSFGWNMRAVTMPRHSASSSAAVKNFDPKNNLPGAVNVCFADSHAAKVPLEQLWELYWSSDWIPPRPRPGK